MTVTKTKDLTLCALFVALIAAGAFIKIPVPVVPFTLQTLFTMLAGLLLGAKRGCTAVCIYIILGLMGLPIFASGGGPGYIFQPACWLRILPDLRSCTCSAWSITASSVIFILAHRLACGRCFCTAFCWSCPVISFCVSWVQFWQRDCGRGLA